MLFRRIAPALGAIALLHPGLVGCSSDEDPPPSHQATDGGVDGRLKEPLYPPASCRVMIDTPEPMGSEHVGIGSEITYNSNPPCTGPHYPIWPAFKEYDAPVDRRYYVHGLEHGAVALLYRCAPTDSGCDATIQGLREVRDSLVDDPACPKGDGLPRVRVIITQDPGLDVPVAAAAWGWIYKADCLDLPTLKDFARDRYGKGPEDTCADGQDSF